MYNTYTIDNEQYVVDGNALYQLQPTTHTKDELIDGQQYLYDDSVVQFDTSLSTLKAIRIQDNCTFYPNKKSLEATPVSRVLPSGIAECPLCGGWLGPKDSEDKFCNTCEYEP